MAEYDRNKFHRAMATYYKSERDRAENTLGMIASVASGEGPIEPLFDAIVTILIKHYSRA